MLRVHGVIAALSFSLCACDEGGSTAANEDASVDAAPEAGELGPASVAHCRYQSQPANANSAGPLQPGTLFAGVGERVIDFPIGSAMGGYSSRAGVLGTDGWVDDRKIEYSGTFVPSFGVETRPRAKALALTAGSEKVIILKADLIMADDNVTAEVADRLGPEYAGKVLFAASHSHGTFAQYSTNVTMAVGLGLFRTQSYDALVDALEAAAREAIASLAPAQIGIAHDDDFDPSNTVSHDRRPQNDDLSGGPRKDHDLYVIRVDRASGEPLAVLPIFGIHGTSLSAKNNYASTEVIGAIERTLEESFDGHVLVMHLQGAGGDVSPGGTVDTDCTNEGSVCHTFARLESVGRAALAEITAAWASAGSSMQMELPIEMITRVVPLGPDWSTFTVRNGALSYAPFDPLRIADRMVFDTNGQLLSPIDEFNAPHGAAFCGEDTVSIAPGGQMPGTMEMQGYGSCSKIDKLAPFVSALLEFEVGSTPVCGSTRTTVSALRLGEHVIATVPGEPLTLLADLIRNRSAHGAANTIVVGYAQGHVGYVMTADDWVRGGYEPSINLWGPLEGEYIAERSLELVALASNDVRDNGTQESIYEPPAQSGMIPAVDASPMRGTVPSSVPSQLYARGNGRVSQAQPVALISRMMLNSFVWIGEDPFEGTPTITLEHEVSPGSGTYEPVRRDSGRLVQDGDILLSETPIPLRRDGNQPRTHYWAVEWQAVPAVGQGDDAPDARSGVPLGRYRFAIEGSGYSLTSDPFEVQAAHFVGRATRADASVQLFLSFDATHGFRMLYERGVQNGIVAAQNASVEVVLLDAHGDALETRSGLTLDGGGALTLTDVSSSAASVHVTDRFGNIGEFAIE